MMKEKLTESEVEQVKKSVEEAEQWLVNDSTKEEYEGKYNELTQQLNPILMKIQSSPEGVQPSTEGMGPVVDEVD